MKKKNLSKSKPFTYRDARRFSSIPVSKISKPKIETLYSLAHLDGPMTGLVSWKGRIYYASGFESSGNRNYWIVYLTDEQIDSLLKQAKLWAERFSNSMTWLPDGRQEPYKKGNALEVWGPETKENRWYERFLEEAPPYSYSDLLNQPVVGYMDGWPGEEDDDD